MNFSDEELKRLKCDKAYKEVKACSCHYDIKSLLARLEAAEALISDYPQYEPEWEEKRQVWRKAAGKGA